MTIIAEKRNGLQPGEYYPDFVQVWLSVALTPGHVRRLKRLCPNLDVLEEPMRHNPEWIMRLQARQPNHAFLLALQKIEATQKILINYVELARDECCDGRDALVRLYCHRCRCEVRLWHHKRQQVTEDVGSITWDAMKRKPRLLARYMEKFCRLTGECDCLHEEFRLMGVQSVRRAGIRTVKDLIDFDHAKWWQSKTRVVDVELLGRLLRNNFEGTHDTKPRFKLWRSLGRVVNLDSKVGGIMLAGHDSMHRCLGHYRSWLRVERAYMAPL